MSSSGRPHGEGSQGHRGRGGLCLQEFYEGGASAGAVRQEPQEFQDLRGPHCRGIHLRIEVRGRRRHIVLFNFSV